MTDPNESIHPLNGWEGVLHNKDATPISSLGDIHIGITKREYFAAFALSGLATLTNKEDYISDSEAETFARDAVLLADKLIAELNKPVNDKP